MFPLYTVAKNPVVQSQTSPHIVLHTQHSPSKRPGLLLDAINRAKTFYFTNRYCWDERVQRDMDKNVSWENSAWQYRNLYLEMTRDKA